MKVELTKKMKIIGGLSIIAVLLNLLFVEYAPHIGLVLFLWLGSILLIKQALRFWKPGTIAGVVVITAIMITLVTILTLPVEWRLNSMWFWVIVLVITAGYLWDRGKVRIPSSWKKWEALSLAGILLLALFFRTYRLGSIPLAVYTDELEYLAPVARIIKGNFLAPFSFIEMGMSALLCYFTVPFAKIITDPVIASRLTHATMGLAAVLFMFLFTREVFDSKTALVASFFLAVSSWQINESRCSGYTLAMELFFTLAALYFLFLGLKRNRQIGFALSGLFLGLGLIRLHLVVVIPPAIFLFLIAEAIFNKRKITREYLISLGLLLLATLVTLWPIIFKFFQTGRALTDIRYRFSIFGPGYRSASQIKLILSHFRSASSWLLWRVPVMFPYDSTIAVGKPLVNPVVSLFFLLGLGYSIVRLRKPFYLFLVILLLVSVAPFVISIDPTPWRLVLVVAAIFPLAAVGVGMFLRFLKKKKYVILGLILLFSYLSWAGFYDYFCIYPSEINFHTIWTEGYTCPTALGRKITTLSEQHQTYVYSGAHRGATKIAGSIANFVQYRRLGNLLDVPVAEPIKKDLAFVIETTFLGLHYNVFYSVLPLLKYYYPEGKLEELRDPVGRLAGFIYLVNKEDALASQGLTGNYYEGIGFSGEPRFIRRDERIDFDWRDQAPLPFPFSVEWTGTLLISRYDEYIFRLTANGSSSVFIDGKRVEEKIFLAPGHHEIKVRAIAREEEGLSLYWSTSGAETEKLLPQERLSPFPPYDQQGLVGRYYQGSNCEGEPLFTRLDPTLYLVGPFLPSPFSVEWEGKIDIPSSGLYDFNVACIGRFSLYINEELVLEFEGVNPKGIAFISGTISVYLEEGFHDIRARYISPKSRGIKHLSLHWKPPSASFVAPYALRPHPSIVYLKVIPANILYPRGAKIALPSFSSVRKNLKEGDYYLRRETIQSLYKANREEAVSCLREAFRDQSPSLCTEAMEVATGIGLPALPALSEALAEHEDWNMRAHAAVALGIIGGREAIHPLTQALKDKNGVVRSNVVRALNKINSPETVPTFIIALDDEDSNIRLYAVMALGNIGDSEAIPALAGVLGDEEFSVRLEAVRALGSIADPQAVPLLARSLKDSNHHVRSASAKSLAKIGNEEALGLLEKARRTEKDGQVQKIISGILEKKEK
jgi:HEAT repeat protein/4-amino-4-deoxy-L-arabinose transferase-like glycosyltransferase